jgi:hypothetical protein
MRDVSLFSMELPQKGGGGVGERIALRGVCFSSKFIALIHPISGIDNLVIVSVDRRIKFHIIYILCDILYAFSMVGPVINV